jgi:hypothetical protein
MIFNVFGFFTIENISLSLFFSHVRKLPRISLAVIDIFFASNRIRCFFSLSPSPLKWVTGRISSSTCASSDSQPYLILQIFFLSIISPLHTAAGARSHIFLLQPRPGPGHPKRRPISSLPVESLLFHGCLLHCAAAQLHLLPVRALYFFFLSSRGIACSLATALLSLPAAKPHGAPLSLPWPSIQLIFPAVSSTPSRSSLLPQARRGASSLAEAPVRPRSLVSSPASCPPCSTSYGHALGFAGACIPSTPELSGLPLCVPSFSSARRAWDACRRSAPPRSMKSLHASCLSAELHRVASSARSSTQPRSSFPAGPPPRP